MALRSNLSRQGTAIRGGISARTPTYHSGPVASRQAYPDYNAYQGDAVAMQETSPNVFEPGEGEDARRGIALRGPKNAFESLAMDDFSGDLGRGAGSRALTGAMMTSLAGAPLAAALTPGFGVSAISDAAKHGIATHRVGNTYGEVLNNLSRDKYDTMMDTYRGVEDPTEVYSPKEMTAFDQTRQATQARRSLMGVTGTPETAASVANAGLSLSGNPIPRPFNALLDFVGLPALMTSDIIKPKPTMTSGGGEMSGHWADDWANDLPVDLQRDLRELGVLGNRQYTELPSDFYKSKTDRDAERAHNIGIEMGRSPTMAGGFDQSIKSNRGRALGGPVSSDMRGRDGGESGGMGDDGRGQGGTRGGGRSDSGGGYR